MNNRLVQKQRTTWLLLLALLGALVLAGCGGAPAFSLTGVDWQWQSVTDQGATTTVPNPASYTVNFATDGTLSGQADCNRFAGTYTTENNGILVLLGPTTLAACPEGSLDQLYLQTLGQVVAGGNAGDGNLALETGAGAQRMLFANPAAADSAAGFLGLPWWLWLLLGLLLLGLLWWLFGRSKPEPPPPPKPVERPQPAAPVVKAEPAPKKIEEPAILVQDDLTLIEGVGPKTNDVLHDAGIHTFAQLAAASQAELRSILEAAGMTGAYGDPTTWPEQAGLAAAGQWDDLRALQDKLDRGRPV